MQTIRRCAWGIVASVLAYAFSSLLPYHDKAPVLISFTVAAVLVSWFAGRTAGLCSWATGVCAAYYLIVSHVHTWSIIHTSGAVRLINTSLITFGGVLVVASLRSTLRHNSILLKKERSALSERDQLISELHTNAERLRLTQKAARAWNWEIRKDGDEFVLYRDSNPLIGGTPTLSFGEWLSSRVHPQDRDPLRARLNESFASKNPLDAEFRIRSRKGDFRWIHTRGSCIGDRMLGVSMDVTLHKAVEENLRRSQERFESLARATFEGIAIASDWRIVDVNAQLAQMLGYTPDEMIGQDVSVFIVPEDRERVLKNAMSGGGPIRHEMLRRDCSRLTVEARGRTTTYQNRTLRVTSIRDITEQRQAEESIATLNRHLQRRAEELQAIFETVPIGLAIAEDPQARRIRGNPANESLLGVARGGEFSLTADQPPPFRVLKDGRQLAAGELPMQRAARGESIVGQSLDVIRGDGTTVTLHASAAPLFDEQNRPRGAVGAFVDISERKNMEEALRESREHLRAMAESLPHVVWSCDAEGNFDYMSQRWFDYTGMEHEESFNPTGYLGSIHPDERGAVARSWIATLKKGIENSTELRLRRKDGQYRWQSVRAVPLKDTEGKVVRWFGTLTDIEDMKRAQASLIQSEKLASTGRLAATIAHEINNPLAATMNALFLIGMDRSLSDGSRELLGIADTELRHAAQITRQTLGFYRESGLPAAVCVSDSVEALLALYAKRIRDRGVKVERRHREVLPAFVVEGELRQMVANLVANALDACPRGGTIYVRTSGNRNRVRVVVADTGSGIATENLTRIFDAFFTTKEKLGTGLGLWVVKELASKHHGNVRVRSAPGKGAVFVLSLPVASGTDAPVRRKPQSTAKTATCG